jgi:hypothetical protein
MRRKQIPFRSLNNQGHSRYYSSFFLRTPVFKLVSSPLHVNSNNQVSKVTMPLIDIEIAIQFIKMCIKIFGGHNRTIASQKELNISGNMDNRLQAKARLFLVNHHIIKMNKRYLLIEKFLTLNDADLYLQQLLIDQK